METKKDIRDLMTEDEHVAGMWYASEVMNIGAPKYYFIVPNFRNINEVDVLGCIEDTLHRALDEGWSKQDVRAVLGLESEIDYCYSTKDKDSSEVVIIKYGENGYEPTNYPFSSHDEAELFVEKMNNSIGVTSEEKDAMYQSSMFGWDDDGIRLSSINGAPIDLGYMMIDENPQFNLYPQLLQKSYEIRNPYCSEKTEVFPKLELYAQYNWLDQEIPGICVDLLCRDDEGDIVPYSRLTVNLPHPMTGNVEAIGIENAAYIDINNCPEGIELLNAIGAKPVKGQVRRSGMCEYPLYVFPKEFLKDADPVNYKIYSEAWHEEFDQSIDNEKTKSDDEVR